MWHGSRLAVPVPCVVNVPACVVLLWCVPSYQHIAGPAYLVQQLLLLSAVCKAPIEGGVCVTDSPQVYVWVAAITTTSSSKPPFTRGCIGQAGCGSVCQIGASLFQNCLVCCGHGMMRHSCFAYLDDHTAPAVCTLLKQPAWKADYHCQLQSACLSDVRACLHRQVHVHVLST